MLKDILGNLEKLDRLIHVKGTGSPRELAKRVGISERSLYEYLKLMKDRGAPVAYSRERGTYFYEDNGKFTVMSFANAD